MSGTTMKSILVIEDDHDTRVSLRRSLELEGYFVFSAADGQQGLETLQRIKLPSLILLDMAMPVMDGGTFLKSLEAHPELKGVPVVVLSAYPDLAATLAEAFVAKPLDLKTLLKTVRDHIGED